MPRKELLLIANLFRMNEWIDRIQRFASPLYLLSGYYYLFDFVKYEFVSCVNFFQYCCWAKLWAYILILKVLPFYQLFTKFYQPNVLYFSIYNKSLICSLPATLWKGETAKNELLLRASNKMQVLSGHRGLGLVHCCLSLAYSRHCSVPAWAWNLASDDVHGWLPSSSVLTWTLTNWKAATFLPVGL